MLTLSLSLADAVASLAVLWLRWLRRGCAGYAVAALAVLGWCYPSINRF